MCGIVGATGTLRVVDVLLSGMARLEYRGYDSAGLAVVIGPPSGGNTPDANPERRAGTAGIWRERRAEGTKSVADLASSIGTPEGAIHAGVGHVRWATHGRPDEHNAHPHLDCTGKVAIVHNGIIENFTALAACLVDEGHQLVSDTDTEVVAHLLESRIEAGESLVEAVREVIALIDGTFAIAAVYAGDPDLIVAARRVSPLIVGRSDGAGLVASDIPAILGETREVFSLDDDQVAEIRPGSIVVTDRAGQVVVPRRMTIEWDLEEAEKGGFDDFMSKEIREQPTAVADTLRGRLSADGTVLLDEERLTASELREVDKVFIVACGSSYHAGLVAKYAIEHWARLPVEIDIASEFRYRDPVLDSRTLVVGVSQSGETVDTIQAMRGASEQGAKTLVISNVVDSSMARESDAVLYTRAGPELCVAATKTHLAQVAALQVLALHLAQVRGSLYPEESAQLIEDLRSMPARIDQVIARADAVTEVAGAVAGAKDFLFLGRHVGYPVALEGALKLKEISYLRAEGYPAGELKHGPIALIEEGVVVVAIATLRADLLPKMLGNIEEVKSRGAIVVVVATDGDSESVSRADHVLWVPGVPHSLFTPIVDVVPLQLLAYELARMRGNNVDRPRNLAKTVTVE